MSTMTLAGMLHAINLKLERGRDAGQASLKEWRDALTSAIAQNAPAMEVDSLAQEIRRVDGMHMLGASALAEALMPFIANSIHAERARVPDGMVLLDHEAKALHWLVELAASSWNLADNTEGNGKSLTVDADDFERMSKSLEALETLPDDKPGWTLGPAGKASWALRRVFAAEGPIAAPSQPESRS